MINVQPCNLHCCDICHLHVSIIIKNFSIMMIPKEDMICFIVLFDNKNIWFGEKNQVSISIIDKGYPT